MKGRTTERDPPPIGPNGLFTHIGTPLLFRAGDFPSAASIYVYRCSSLLFFTFCLSLGCGEQETGTF